MIVVLTKVPVAGQVKTRLVPALGEAGAAELAAAMAGDVFEQVAALGHPWRIAVAGATEHPWVTTLPAPWEPQADGDLGAKLRHALRDGGIAIGTDCPILPPGLFADASASPADVFLGLADDGGYVLVRATARAVAAGLFDDVTWSSPRTAESQHARALACGLTVATSAGYFDVDEPADLGRLAFTLRHLPPDLAPRTRAFLGLA